MSNIIEVSAQLNRANLLPDEEHLAYLALRIQGKKIEQAERPGLNLGMVMDRSGSMSGSKIDYTRQALGFCINNLDVKDILSVAAFDDQVEVILPPGPVVNKDAAKAQIARINARGMTNLSGGLMTGHNLVKSSQTTEKVNRLIMMTDGLANQGITDHKGLVNLAGNISSSGQSLTCIGVGEDFDEDLLTRMSERGKGNFYFVENPDLIPPIFAEELQGLLQVVAQNLIVDVIPRAGVHISRIFGYQPIIGKNNSLSLNLPDLYSSEEKLLLMEIKIPPMVEGIHSVLGIKCSCLDTSTQETLEIMINVEVHATRDDEKLAQFNEEVDKSVELMKIADIREEAIRLADAGRFDEARNSLKFGIAMATNSSFANDADIICEANELQTNIEYMQSYTAAERKRMQYSTHQRRKNRK